MMEIKNIFRGLRDKQRHFEQGREAAMTEGSSSGEIFAAIAMALSEITVSAGRSSEVHAAIAMALSSTIEWHDVESNVLTIHNVANNYSPWSSKIYTLRELPLRR